jgi:hypothetical protein
MLGFLDSFMLPLESKKNFNREGGTAAKTCLTIFVFFEYFGKMSIFLIRDIELA